MPELYTYIEDLERVVREGLVSKRRHPRLPLYIYNYTPKCVYTSAWSAPTLDARGLILDHAGLIVGRSMRKFFDYDQHLQVFGKFAPDGRPYVFDKLDGFLTIVTSYEGQRIVATRGSFESPQARTAEAWLAAKARAWNPIYNRTYLFEGLFAEHRIVVPYPQDALVYLGCCVNTIGNFMAPSLDPLGFCSIVQSHPKMEDYPVQTFLASRKAHEREEDETREGYVLWWPSCGTRIKVKLPSYIAKHRVRFRLTPHVVWECCAEQRWFEVPVLLEGLDAEFREAVTTYKAMLLTRYTEMEEALNMYFRTISGLSGNLTKRERAQLIQAMAPNFTGPNLSMELLCHYCFARFSEKDATKMIWRSLEPSRAETF